MTHTDSAYWEDEMASLGIRSTMLTQTLHHLRAAESAVPTSCPDVQSVVADAIRVTIAEIGQVTTDRARASKLYRRCLREEVTK